MGAAAKEKEQVGLKEGIGIMVGYLPHSLKWHALVQNAAVVGVQVRSLRSSVQGDRQAIDSLTK